MTEDFKPSDAAPSLLRRQPHAFLKQGQLAAEAKALLEKHKQSFKRPLGRAAKPKSAAGPTNHGQSTPSGPSQTGSSQTGSNPAGSERVWSKPRGFRKSAQDSRAPARDRSQADAAWDANQAEPNHSGSKHGNKVRHADPLQDDHLQDDQLQDDPVIEERRLDQAAIGFVLAIRDAVKAYAGNPFFGVRLQRRYGSQKLRQIWPLLAAADPMDQKPDQKPDAQATLLAVFGMTGSWLRAGRLPGWNATDWPDADWQGPDWQAQPVSDVMPALLRRLMLKLYRQQVFDRTLAEPWRRNSDAASLLPPYLPEALTAKYRDRSTRAQDLPDALAVKAYVDWVETIPSPSDLAPSDFGDQSQTDQSLNDCVEALIGRWSDGSLSLKAIGQQLELYLETALLTHGENQDGESQAVSPFKTLPVFETPLVFEPGNELGNELGKPDLWPAVLRARQALAGLLAEPQVQVLLKALFKALLHQAALRDQREARQGREAEAERPPERQSRLDLGSRLDFGWLKLPPAETQAIARLWQRRFTAGLPDHLTGDVSGHLEADPADAPFRTAAAASLLARIDAILAPLACACWRQGVAMSGLTPEMASVFGAEPADQDLDNQDLDNQEPANQDQASAEAQLTVPYDPDWPGLWHMRQFLAALSSADRCVLWTLVMTNTASAPGAETDAMLQADIMLKAAVGFAHGGTSSEDWSSEVHPAFGQAFDAILQQRAHIALLHRQSLQVLSDHFADDLAEEPDPELADVGMSEPAGPDDWQAQAGQDQAREDKAREDQAQQAPADAQGAAASKAALAAAPEAEVLLQALLNHALQAARLAAEAAVAALPSAC